MSYPCLRSYAEDEESLGTIEDIFSNEGWETKTKRFSPKQIRSVTSKFSKILGSGSCGDVYLGKYDGQSVAVKVLKKEVLADNIKDQFVAEVSTLRKTHHRNLVKLYGFCFQPKMKALVYEFMEMGSLDKFLNGKSSMKWETLCNIAIGTAKGLSYLHEDCQPSIIHYDIKPSNILIDSKFSPKIGDFGLAKLLKMDVTHITASKFRGTPYYCAPELSLPYLNKVNHKCDVYSYGMMLFDIVSMRKHQSQEAEDWFPRLVYNKYEKGKLEEVMADCIEAKDRDMAKRILMIALSCVEFWASKRPSMKDVVRLLEGTKDPLMPPNHFLSTLQDSESAEPNSRYPDKLALPFIPKYRKDEHSDGQDWRMLVSFVKSIGETKENRNLLKSTSREMPIYAPAPAPASASAPAKLKQKMFRDDRVQNVSEEEVRQRREHISKPNLDYKKSHFVIFLFALFLILFLKFHVDLIVVWFKKLVLEGFLNSNPKLAERLDRRVTSPSGDVLVQLFL